MEKEIGYNHLQMLPETHSTQALSPNYSDYTIAEGFLLYMGLLNRNEGVKMEEEYVKVYASQLKQNANVVFSFSMRGIVQTVMRLAGIYNIIDKSYQKNKYSGSDRDPNKEIHESMKTFLEGHTGIREELLK